MSCTLSDVARTAGVSAATVSRVINGAANVSDSTRSKVLSAISTLKFSPDVRAVELRRGKGGIRRKRGNRVVWSTRIATDLHSDQRAMALNVRQYVGKIRLLEEENARLKRLVSNLCMDVEMWKRIAQ